MAQPLYVLEAVDVRRADEPDSSRAVTLSKLALPEIKRKTSGYAPGGGVGEVNFSFPQVDAIEPKFELKGFDPDMLRKMAGDLAGNVVMKRCRDIAFADRRLSQGRLVFRGRRLWFHSLNLS